ncbi:MAG TPA: hypothetical protein PKO15_03130 [Fibrobacteria bacterium]|nr:hypothetical protein [Fibrobacteria bacterium]HOX50537.1 hypothetical protein [Fibrobacteria bacterium]
MTGGIFLISANPDHSAKWSRWILDWIERSGSDLENVVYLCDSPSLARESLALPVREGDPPAMVLVDRSTPGCDSDLAKMISDCIPETWVIEILAEQNAPSTENGAIMALRESARRDEWEAVLHHCLHESPAPQWSKAMDL